MQGFITYLSIFVILLSKRSSAADLQYERCEPRHCSTGPNISFPFYLWGLQESYCSYPYPGFQLNCSADGLTVANFSGDEYVVEEISYGNQSLHVVNAAVSGTGCIPSTIRTMTLPSRFSYVRTTNLSIFSNCTEPLPDMLSGYRFGCDNWGIALLGTNKEELMKDATEYCGTSVVAPVEDYGIGNDGVVNTEDLLRRGFALDWAASDCSVCKGSGGRCGYNWTSLQFRCFCTDRPHSRSCKPGSHLTLILATILAGVGAILVLCSIVSCIIWRRMKKIKTGYRLSRTMSTSPSSKPDIEAGSLYGIPIFSYKELEEATCKFNPSKELGDGGYGTVYHGKLQDGREVAVKRLYEHNCRRVEQFMNEIRILTSLKHPNLVTLYGCTSRRSQELLLVYEYIPNGTVADHLHGEHAKESTLSWPVRMNIAIETASALAYLHKTDIIHRDVKTNNILLDNNFCVKVADFGLSRLFPTDVTHISTAPQGTPGYVDPEYHQCYQLTDRSDVYSFGVVLIELISSMPAVDVNRHRHEINLANLAVNRIQRCALDELIDPSLGYGTDPQVTRMTTAVAELAFRCLQLEKEMRPSMDEALTILKDIQAAEDCGLEKTKEASVNCTVAGNGPASPETEDVSLLKNKNYQASPIAVIDAWPSSSSTTSSIG